MSIVKYAGTFNIRVFGQKVALTNLGTILEVPPKNWKRPSLRRQTATKLMEAGYTFELFRQSALLRMDQPISDEKLRLFDLLAP